MPSYDAEARSWGFDFSMQKPTTLANIVLSQQRQEWKQHIDDVKLAFGVFERAFSNPALSESSRNHMLQLAGMLQSSLTREEQIALAGIGSTRILSADEMKAREFDQRFPVPKPPRAPDGSELPHTPENVPTWAAYNIRLAERAQKRAIAIYGVEKGKELVKLPKLFQTDERNVYAFRNPLTRNIGFINLKEDLPEGLLKRAIDKGSSLSEIAVEGGFNDPDIKARTVYYNGGAYNVAPYVDLRTGQRGVKSTPIGPAPAKELPSALRNVMMAFNIEDDEKRDKLFKNAEEAGLYESLKAAMDLSDPVEKASAFANIRRQLLQSYPESGWVPFIAQQKKGSFWNFARSAKKDVYYEKDSGIVWRRINGIKEFVDANNQKIVLYTTPSGEAVDKNGKDVPQAKGKESGAVLPDVVARAPQTRNMTVGEFSKTIASTLVQGTDIQQDAAAKKVEQYARKWQKGRLVKTEDFQNILDFLLSVPKPVFNQLKDFEEWLANLPVPGTATRKK